RGMITWNPWGCGMEKHALEEYIEKLQERKLLLRHNCTLETAKRTVNHVAYDSNKTARDTLFVCKGAGFREAYLQDAVRRGAFAYISEVEYDVPVPCLLVSDVKKALALAASIFFGSPAKDLCIVGITGTKGKSTTAYYIK